MAHSHYDQIVHQMVHQIDHQQGANKGTTNFGKPNGKPGWLSDGPPNGPPNWSITWDHRRNHQFWDNKWPTGLMTIWPTKLTTKCRPQRNIFKPAVHSADTPGVLLLVDTILTRKLYFWLLKEQHNMTLVHQMVHQHYDKIALQIVHQINHQHGTNKGTTNFGLPNEKPG